MCSVSCGWYTLHKADVSPSCVYYSCTICGDMGVVMVWDYDMELVYRVGLWYGLVMWACGMVLWYETGMGL